MSNNLRDLYQQVIIDHSKRPRNFCTCEHVTHTKDGHNPLCGDRITLYIDAKDNTIVDICFQGQGCAISMASASLMTEAVKGKTIDEFLQLFNAFQKLVTTPAEQEVAEELTAQLGKLTVLAGVREFPIRVKCATLAWHTLKAALTGESSPVTTE
jgi:nitrogen fixation protein NifU and related proteins